MIKNLKSILIFVLFLLSITLLACDQGLVPAITITNPLSKMEVGETVELECTVSNFEGELHLTSSDPSVILVEANKLTALKEGSAVITVKAGSTEAKLPIKVSVVEYTVTFVGNDGSELKVQTVKKGEDATAPVVNDPLFIGWDKEFTNVTSDLTVNALYGKEFTVKFIGKDGQELKVEKVAEGKAATAPEVTDEMFKGWDKDFSNVTSDLVVTAQYKKYSKINYLLYGGAFKEGEEGVTSYLEGEVVVLSSPIKAGYDFVGWATSTTSTDYFTEISADQTGNLVLYAIWEKAGSRVITFDFNGGVSDELYVADKENAVASITINNFNNSDGAFWGGGYSSYVYMTDGSKDPGATFSDRIYIGKDSETGLWKIISILTSGASSWPSGAEYVITISSSYSGYRTVHAEVLKLAEGMTVVFDGNYKTFCGSNPGKVYFFDKAPTITSITLSSDDTKEFITPSLLGAKFLGWFDEDGNEIKKFEDATSKKLTVKAKWEMLNPVTDITITEICEEMTTASTFQIVASVVPADAYFKQILYSTSDPDVVSVDANGKLTSLNAGTAVITITDYVKNIKIEKTITVYAIDSIDIQFEKGFDGVLNVGETVQLTPVALGKGVNNPTFTFKSSDANILEVSATGLVTAKALGTATIEITDNTGSNYKLTVGLTVDPLTTEQSIDKIIALIAKNNFATIETGNMCLYNDGTDRYYDSMYGSVNKYLFSPYVINTQYAATAEANSGGHKDRRFTGGFDDSIQFVTVHDTATLTGTVASIASNMASGGTSIHYTTGNDAIYQVVPEKYIAYHAGDGTGTPFKWYPSGVTATGVDVNDYNTYPTWDIVNEGGKWYWVINGTKSNIEAPISNGTKTISSPSKANITDLGPAWKVVDGEFYLGTTWVDFSQMAIGAISSHGGNNNSVGIEMCVNISGDIYDTLQRTAQLVADILIRNNLDLSRVKMHNTWSGKNCPQVLRAGNYWWNFIDMVALNYEIMKNYPTAEITMVSDNPTIVDNTGRVIKAPNTTTTVSYTVTVKLDGQTKTIKLYSVVPGATTWQQWNGTYPSKQIWNEGNYVR